MIISVPNFRYYSVLWQLAIRGHIQYVDAGILDRTHLRITTRRMVVDWLSQVGLHTVSWTYKITRRRDKIISAVCLQLAAEFIARQIIVIGSSQSGENNVRHTYSRDRKTALMRDKVIHIQAPSPQICGPIPKAVDLVIGPFGENGRD